MLKESLLNNIIPSNNKISLKNKIVFFYRPNMFLKEYNFLKILYPGFFKLNSQENYYYFF